MSAASTAPTSSYAEMLEKDTQLLWSILDYFRRHKELDRWMARIVSKYPWQDVVIVVWFFAAVGVVEIGWLHVWVTSTNLLVALAARNFLEAKRPLEVDRRFQPLTDTNAESYGFPSLESYMAVVVMGHLTMHLQSVAFGLMAVVVAFVVGVSRLYSRARFPHQVFGSWLLGVPGLFVSTHCCTSMGLHTMKDFEHHNCAILVGSFFVFYMAMAIESNDCRLLHIPKKEFLAVIVGIIDASNEEVRRVAGTTDSIDLDGNFTGTISNRSRGQASSTRQPAGNSGGSARNSKNRGSRARRAGDEDYSETKPKQRRDKRDSFFFLQKGMEERQDYYRQQSSVDSKLRQKQRRERTRALMSYVGLSWGRGRPGADDDDGGGGEDDDARLARSSVARRRQRLREGFRSARQGADDVDGHASTDYYSSGGSGSGSDGGALQSSAGTSPRSDHERSPRYNL